jgi:hypothetical protein
VIGIEAATHIEHKFKFAKSGEFFAFVKSGNFINCIKMVLKNP